MFIVYRCFSAKNQLLYVGCSIRGVYRLSEHREGPWFGSTARIELTHFESRQAMLLAERFAIQDEKPVFNKVLNSERIESARSSLLRTTAAIAYFGSVKALAARLEVSDKAIYQWPENVPEGRAYQLEAITDGALKAVSA